MRVSIIEQAKTFILDSKKSNNYVYFSGDIKLSLKNYLIKNKLLFSPIRGLFVLKASSISPGEIIKKYKFNIIKKLGWVISWEFVLNYYTSWIKTFKEIEIINNSKNFIAYLWEEKPIKLIYKKSTVPRIVVSVSIEWEKLDIESPISFIINNFSKYKNNKKFHELILKQDINSWDIINLIFSKFKLSWISKLAIFYKNNKYDWKYLTIHNELKAAWKRIDRRDNKIDLNKIVYKAKRDHSIDSLDSLF